MYVLVGASLAKREKANSRLRCHNPLQSGTQPKKARTDSWSLSPSGGMDNPSQTRQQADSRAGHAHVELRGEALLHLPLLLSQAHSGGRRRERTWDGQEGGKNGYGAARDEGIKSIIPSSAQVATRQPYRQLPPEADRLVCSSTCTTTSRWRGS